MKFPNSLSFGLYHIPEAPTAFSDWVKKYMSDWDFDNILAAHNGTRIGGAKQQLQTVWTNAQPTFASMVEQYTKTPVAADAALFKVMQAHEAMCKE